MGIVTPETPNYTPLPSAGSAAAKLTGAAALGAAVVLSEHHQPHLHLETHDQGPPPSHFVTAVSSTSSTPFFGSTFDAADVVIQADHQRRYAQAIGASYTFSTPDVLLKSL